MCSCSQPHEKELLLLREAIISKSWGYTSIGVARWGPSQGCNYGSFVPVSRCRLEGFPWWSSGPILPMQRAQVQPLVGELDTACHSWRSHTPELTPGTVNKKEKMWFIDLHSQCRCTPSNFCPLGKKNLWRSRVLSSGRRYWIWESFGSELLGESGCGLPYCENGSPREWAFPHYSPGREGWAELSELITPEAALVTPPCFSRDWPGLVAQSEPGVWRPKLDSVSPLCMLSCLVMSDSLCPHGLYFARLLCPWDFPGKKTELGCQFPFQAIFPPQWLNPHLLHWQADSLPLSHLGSLQNVAFPSELWAAYLSWLEYLWFCWLLRTCNWFSIAVCNFISCGSNIFIKN